MKVLFLTISNIKTDARILRSFKSLSSIYKDASFIGFGVNSRDEFHEGKYNSGLSLENINLIFPIKYISKYLNQFLFFFELNFRYLWVLLKFRPTLVHVNDFHPLFAVACYSLIFKVKIVYDAHELESEKSGLNNFKSKLIFSLEKLSWGKVNLLISPSTYINDWYVENIGKKKNIVILNTPDNFKLYEDYNANYLREHFNISYDDKIFIYVGILNFGRGINLLLDVFSDPSVNSHCVFLGYGPYTDEIIRFTESNYRIHYHSPVAHESVTSLVRGADVGLAMIENVSLSDYYCAPNKLFEYAFSSIYIVASDFPEMRRIVLNHNLGELVSNDKLSLLNKVKEIESRSSVKLQRINLEELSWNHQADLLVESYRELLKT